MSDEFVFIKPSEKKSEPKTQTFTPDAASESGDFIFVKPSEEKGKSSTGEFSKALTNPALLAGSAVLGAGTVGAQRIALPTEVQKAAHEIRREAAEYVKSGKVPPSGLTSIQKYAGSQQNAIAPQNIDPIHSTPSLVQQNVVHPLTAGTQKALEIAPGAKTVPGSEVGLVTEGHPATVKSLE